MEAKSDNETQAARAAAIASILHDVHAALSEGRPVDFAALIQRHGDLMPEIGLELEKIQRIRRAGADAVELTDGWSVNAAEVLAGEMKNPTIEVPGYKLLREIGRGGQAVVFLALQNSTGRKRAIKLMRERSLSDERAQTRFQREVETLAALNHPNIVTIIDSGKILDGSQFLVMDFIEGMSLDQFMKDRRTHNFGGPADPSKLLRLFLRICNAMAVAHSRGVIHRDLKPSNIIIDDRGEPHVLDFGLARTAIDRFIRGGDAPVSITGEFLGSLPWSSPEQAEGQPDKIDSRTDVYSLGVILYQILTSGRFPYEVVGNIRDVLNNILTAVPTPPSKVIAAQQANEAMGQRKLATNHPTIVNEAIEKIVLKALAKKPDDRYQNAGELGQDISNYLLGLPIAPSTRFPQQPADRGMKYALEHF